MEFAPERTVVATLEMDYFVVKNLGGLPDAVVFCEKSDY